MLRGLPSVDQKKLASVVGIYLSMAIRDNVIQKNMELLCDDL